MFGKAGTFTLSDKKEIEGKIQILPTSIDVRTRVESLKVYDITGKKIVDENNLEAGATISTDMLRKGIYIVEVDGAVIKMLK